ncbi:hypothetical protein B5M09_007330 [Aphanomyces astaci]|uniref:Myb-like domain-containing protein n=1 Tax=Aphanomyces astaci TaxID=112090 RepID=A0A425DQ26_APHAT|nr:hypothetical protein B5M09_007330 [Aphanomyces astaci]
MTTPVKRRNYTDKEDVMLLRQVSLELPFLARRGIIMEKWTAVARALVASDEFTRTDLDAKKANNRFNLLIDSHRKHNKDSERASGVSEEVSEKVLLLDDLLAVVDDAKDEEAKRVVSTQKANQHIENLGSIVRDEAMMSLGKRKQACDAEVVAEFADAHDVKAVVEHCVSIRHIVQVETDFGDQWPFDVLCGQQGKDELALTHGLSQRQKHGAVCLRDWHESSSFGGDGEITVYPE